MPIVRAYFEDIFGRKAEMGVDPMECVAAGAAIQAGVLAGEVGGIVLADVTPLTLGVETLGGIATSLIGRNTPIPVNCCGMDYCPMNTPFCRNRPWLLIATLWPI